MVNGDFSRIGGGKSLEYPDRLEKGDNGQIEKHAIQGTIQSDSHPEAKFF